MALGAKEMTDVLFHAELVDREYGSALLHVPSLLAWSKSNGYHLDADPSLDLFEFVQVEALLCAIERALGVVPPKQADAIASRESNLHEHIEAGIPPQWLLAAEAHLKWRKAIAAAIKERTLSLLDFASKLPIEAVDSRAAPVSVQETAKEKRARLLLWLEEEEKKGPRGALQRVATRENADRSNVGKAIRKAREERDARRRNGEWPGVQFVKSGKRVR